MLIFSDCEARVIVRLIFILGLFALLVDVVAGAGGAMPVLRNAKPRSAAVAMPASPLQRTTVRPGDAAPAPVGLVYTGAVTLTGEARVRVGIPAGPETDVPSASVVGSDPVSSFPTRVTVSSDAAAQHRAGLVDLADLNTVSQTELNMLPGGGAIGRAIIRDRPYQSLDELVSRRILSRARFERIRDRVGVRPSRA